MRASLLTSVALLGLLGAGAQALASQPEAAERAPTDRVSPEVRAALAGGAREVHLVVRLDVPFTPEGYLADDDARERQRRAIERRGQELLGALPSDLVSMSRALEVVPWVVVHGSPRLVDLLARLPAVSLVEEDWQAKPSLAESTALIGAPSAWILGYTGAGQTVAILDSGVNKAHPMLAGKVVSEACYSTDNALTDPLCPNGSTSQVGVGAGVSCDVSITNCDHGTWVAGIAAGDSPSLKGVAPDADLISIQVMSKIPVGLCEGDPLHACVTVYSGDAAAGLQRVYELRNLYEIAAVNMSFGEGSFGGACATGPLNDLAETLRSVGIVPVAASGNDHTKGEMDSPACVPAVVSVGATGDGSGGAAVDEVMDYSNSSVELDLLAPGSWITSANAAGGTLTQDGTSAASPHVAGAIAVMREKAPYITADELVAALTGTGVKLTDPANGRKTPRIDLAAALQSTCHGFGATSKWHDFFSINNEIPWTGDFNRDGKDDIVTFTRGVAGDVYVALSNGSSFGPGTLWHPFFAINDEEPRVGDFNGDGYDDIVTFTRGTSGDVWVALSNGSSFSASRKWHDLFATGDAYPWVADVNGDHKDDILAFTRGTTGDVWVALSQGSRFGTAQLWHGFFSINDELPRSGDLNGDDRDDVLSFNRGTAGDVWVALSTGASFGPGGMWLDDFAYGSDAPLTGDFNRDGRDDVIAFTQGDDADVWVSPSLGTGLGDPSLWHGSFAPYSAIPRVGDFNGDGADDIVSFVRGTGGDVFVSLSTCQ